MSVGSGRSRWTVRTLAALAVPVVLAIALVGPGAARAGTPSAAPAGDTVAGPDATGAAARPVVGYLNHVTTRLDTAAEASALFDSLSSLGLVEAWEFADFGAFSSGGLRLGNLNLEVMGADPTVIPMPSYVTFAPAAVRGLVAGLDARGVDHGPLEVQREGGRVIFASIRLDDLESASFAIQLSAQFVPNRYGPSPVAPPNAAGIVQVAAVTVDVGRDREPVLARLMAPVAVGPWMEFDEGPAVTVRSGRGFGMGPLVLRVADVPRAVRAFSAIGLPVDGSRVSVGTLTFRLVGSRAD